MTTIACKDGLVAWDGRITSRSTIVSDTRNKKIKTSDGFVVLSGDIAAIERYVDDYPNPPLCSGAFAGVRVSNGHAMAIYYTDKGVIVMEDIHDGEHYAWGSGRDHALTAMDLGCSAVDSVRMAAKRDVYTGGKIRSTKIG